MPHAPNSVLGRLVGLIHRVPSALKRQYRHLRDEHQWSDFTIILSVLAIPIITGSLRQSSWCTV